MLPRLGLLTWVAVLFDAVVAPLIVVFLVVVVVNFIVSVSTFNLDQFELAVANYRDTALGFIIGALDRVPIWIMAAIAEIASVLTTWIIISVPKVIVRRQISMTDP